MKNQKISTLINDIYATKENELVCTQVHDLLPVYVEAEYEGKVLERSVVHDIETHLHHCPDCTELYHGLYFLVEQEDGGQLELEESPQPPIFPHHEPDALTPVASS